MSLFLSATISKLRHRLSEDAKTNSNLGNSKICRHPVFRDPSVCEYDNFKTGVCVFLSEFLKQKDTSVRINYYTQAAAASQPNPLRVMTGSLSVKSKMVET